MGLILLLLCIVFLPGIIAAIWGVMWFCLVAIFWFYVLVFVLWVLSGFA